MGRRTLLLLAALVVAALGTTGVFLYVSGVDERASAGYEKTSILVATSRIEAGTPAQQAFDNADIDTRVFFRRSVENIGAMSDISAIADQVALAPIAPGEPILTSQFGEPADSSGLAIPDKKFAVSVQVDDPDKVGNFVHAGSQVAILLTGEAGGGAATRVLLPQVTVIAVGDSTAFTDPGAGGKPSSIFVLAVDQDQAQKVTFAKTQGSMSFLLLGKEASVNPNGPGANAGNLFDQS